MLYPSISNVNKSNKIIKGMLFFSVVISMILLVINYVTTKEFHWALLAILGIMYLWITTIYSIKKNVNIAFHVMLQMLCTSVLLIGIDIILGYRGWSITMGVPIIIIVANLSMVILAIVSHKKYAKYAIYQIIIFIVTLIMLGLIPLKVAKLNVIYLVAFGIAIVTLIVSFCLSGKELISEIRKRFHL